MARVDEPVRYKVAAIRKVVVHVYHSTVSGRERVWEECGHTQVSVCLLCMFCLHLIVATATYPSMRLIGGLEYILHACLLNPGLDM